MSDIQQDLDKEIDRLASFLQKSYKARIKWAKNGGWSKAIQAEIGVAISLGRLDLVGNLMERHSKITMLTHKIAELEYAQRFSGDNAIASEIPPPIIQEENTDSTQFSSEDEIAFADNPKE